MPLSVFQLQDTPETNQFKNESASAMPVTIWKEVLSLIESSAQSPTHA